MTREEAILYLEHTGSDDFNLEEHQIQNRLNAIQFLLKENKKLNGTIQTYDILLKANVEENKQLKEKLNCDLQWAFKYEKQVDNWNKLKEIARSQSGFKKRADLKGGVWFEIDELLDKMQELEQGSDSNE